MGLPQIDIIFKTKAASAIKRSARGIVALIIKDDTADGKPIEIFKSVEDIDFTKFTPRNYEYLKLVFEGAPAKIIVIRMATSDTDVNGALKKLKDLKFNYLTFPSVETGDVATIAAWIKQKRAEKKTFKAVLADSASDHEGIINLTTDNVLSTFSETVFTKAEYCARIAGVLAGLSLARSSTYYVLNDIISCDLHDDPSAAIDAGELIIVFDGNHYKIGRGVNSLTTFTSEKGEDFSKIKIIEGVDLYNDDIRTTFEQDYVGKFRNDYDNKQAFVAAVNAYNKALEGDVLDSAFNNTTRVDGAAQKAYLESKGKDTSTMTDIEILTANTGSSVFVVGNLKFVDAMEDLTLVNNM